MDIFFSDDPRRNARIIILQELFAETFSNIQQDLTTEYASIIYDKEKYTSIKTALKTSLDDIDTMIQKYAKERPIADLNPIDLHILRIGIAEAFFAKVAPPKVVINESVEIAKQYGTESSFKFVNGVLGAVFANEFKSLLQA